MEHNKKNQFDKKDSLEIGNKAEKTFIDVAKLNGYSVKKATSLEDMNEHWDYEISNENESFKIDVKAQKRISRSDTSVQDEWIWVEIHGVRKNDQGWLYGGKSNLIAFERKSDFIIIKIDHLKDLIPKILQLSNTPNPKNSNERYIWVEKSSEAQYKLYQRKGRYDIITLINFSDLEPIIWKKWQK